MRCALRTSEGPLGSLGNRLCHDPVYLSHLPLLAVELRDDCYQACSNEGLKTEP